MIYRPLVRSFVRSFVHSLARGLFGAHKLPASLSRTREAKRAVRSAAETQNAVTVSPETVARIAGSTPRTARRKCRDTACTSHSHTRAVDRHHTSTHNAPATSLHRAYSPVSRLPAWLLLPNCLHRPKFQTDKHSRVVQPSLGWSEISGGECLVSATVVQLPSASVARLSLSIGFETASPQRRDIVPRDFSSRLTRTRISRATTLSLSLSVEITMSRCEREAFSTPRFNDEIYDIL